MTITGSSHAAAPLANITIAGVESKPKSASLYIKGCKEEPDLDFSYQNNTVYVARLERFTPNGAWEEEFELKLW